MNLTHEVPPSDLDAHASPSTPLPRQPRPDLPRLRHPDLETVVRQCGPIPRGAALLGVALDGLPVLLNLRDPAPGPLLVVGDRGSGKRRLLQVMARSADLVQPAGEVTYVVLTDRPAEWEALAHSPNCEGILPFHHPLTSRYISSLAATVRQGSKQPGFLMVIIDGLETLSGDSETRYDMRWFLENGPRHSVWPVVSLTTSRAPALADWIKLFDTVLCGRSSTPLPSVEAKQPPFSGAARRAEFALLTGNQWLPFWVPEPL